MESFKDNLSRGPAMESIDQLVESLYSMDPILLSVLYAMASFLVLSLLLIYQIQVCLARRYNSCMARRAATRMEEARLELEEREPIKKVKIPPEITGTFHVDGQKLCVHTRFLNQIIKIRIVDTASEILGVIKDQNDLHNIADAINKIRLPTPDTAILPIGAKPSRTPSQDVEVQEGVMPGSCFSPCTQWPTGHVILHTSPGLSVLDGAFGLASRVKLEGSTYLYTAFHVLMGALLSDSPTIRSESGDVAIDRDWKVFSASPPSKDGENVGLDYVLVEIPEKVWSRLQVAALTLASTPIAGKTIKVYTVDSQSNFTYSRGTLSTSERPLINNHTATTRPGSCGSAMVLSNGKVIGTHISCIVGATSLRNCFTSVLAFLHTCEQHEMSDDDYEWKKLSVRVKLSGFKDLTAWAHRFGLKQNLDLEQMKIAVSSFVYHQGQVIQVTGFNGKAQYTTSADDTLYNKYNKVLKKVRGHMNDLSLKDMNVLAQTFEQHYRAREAADAEEWTDLANEEADVEATVDAQMRSEFYNADIMQEFYEGGEGESPSPLAVNILDLKQTHKRLHEQLAVAQKAKKDKNRAQDALRIERASAKKKFIEEQDKLLAIKAKAKAEFILDQVALETRYKDEIVVLQKRIEALSTDVTVSEIDSLNAELNDSKAKDLALKAANLLSLQSEQKYPSDDEESDLEEPLPVPSVSLPLHESHIEVELKEGGSNLDGGARRQATLPATTVLTSKKKRKRRKNTNNSQTELPKHLLGLLDLPLSNGRPLNQQERQLLTKLARSFPAFFPGEPRSHQTPTTTNPSSPQSRLTSGPQQTSKTVPILSSGKQKGARSGSSQASKRRPVSKRVSSVNTPIRGPLPHLRVGNPTGSSSKPKSSTS
jgi:hypothetical protein